MPETFNLFGVPETFATEIEILDFGDVTYLIAKNHSGPAHYFIMTRAAYHQALRKMCGESDVLN